MRFILFCSLLSVVAVSGGQDELLQAEGTVILHITFALKQDQARSVNVVFSIVGGWVGRCCVTGKSITLKFAVRVQ